MKTLISIFPAILFAFIFISPLQAIERTLEDPYVLATKLKHAKKIITLYNHLFPIGSRKLLTDNKIII